MKKKGNWIAGAILLCALVGLIILLPRAQKIEDSQQAEQEAQKTSYNTEYYVDQDTDIENAVSLLLQNGSDAFFGGCPLDESFFGWLAQSCGKSAVLNLAYQVTEGNCSSDLWEQETGATVKTLYTQYCQAIGFADYSTQDVYLAETDEDTEPVISVVGDICFDEDWYTMQSLAAKGESFADAISPDLVSLLNNSTVTWVNNEYVLANDGTPLEGKDYTFCAQTTAVNYLLDLGTDIVSLANNHVYDYGAEGLLSTMQTLDTAGIQYVGAGSDLEEASRPVYYIIDGKKVAFVAATQVEISLNYTKEATADSAGVLKCLDPERFCQVIAEAKENADYVIAYVHWGWEGNLYNYEGQRELAEDFALAGADMIIGGHPHRLQGLSYVDGVPVAYSLGNFWFSTGSLYTTVAQITFREDGTLGLSLVPCEQKDMTTSILTDPDQIADFYQYVADYSSFVQITEDGQVYPAMVTETESTDDSGLEFVYFCGQGYTNYNGAVDLDGYGIDKVGNRE